MFQKVQHIHFVGIGGAGMNGIAEILLNMGFRISGSDQASSEQTRRLSTMGGTIFQGHHRKNISGAEVLVYSSAILPDNPEVIAAKESKVPVISRAEMLAELMRLRYGIAVAGAHGKTTTTTMVASVMAEGGLDPTAVIGGKVNSFGGHAKKGEGDFLVAEADESDGSFMKLCPTIAVVTGLDHEHLDYYKTFETIQATFLDFINKIPFYGMAILCGDDPHLRALLPHVEKRVLTYGTEEGLDLIAEEIAFHEWKTMFRARLHGKTLGDFHLPAPGVHNVLNALAAIAVGLELEMPVSEIQKGVQSYQGVQRRFHLQGEKDGVLVVDDYAHHPTEIRATLQAAKQGWNAEVAVVFQPHRYTRTRDCLEALAESFQHADHLILSEIYPAGEKAIPGIDGQRLYQAVLNHRQRKTHFLQDRSDIVASLRKIAKPGMVILTLGAGDVWKVGEAFLKGAG